MCKGKSVSNQEAGVEKGHAVPLMTALDNELRGIGWIGFVTGMLSIPVLRILGKAAEAVPCHLSHFSPTAGFGTCSLQSAGYSSIVCTSYALMHLDLRMTEPRCHTPSI